MTWMVRLLDGPFAGQTRRIPHDPAEEMVVVQTGEGEILGIDGPDFDNLSEFQRELLKDWTVARYERVQMSKLPEDDPMVESGAIIRGAEYRLVANR